MASLRCLPLTVTMAALFVSAPTYSMQALDDQSLSDVTGQAQGLRITDDQEIIINSLSYHDDDGHGIDGTPGVITLNSVRQYSASGRPSVRDFEVKDLGQGRGIGLIMTSRQLDISREIEDVLINDKSLGGFGQMNYSFDDGDFIQTGIYAGGSSVGGVGAKGISFDVNVPSSLSYDTWHSTNDAKRFVTTNYDDPYNPGQGGMFFQNFTIDIVDDGVRLGLPTISNGFMNQYNECVGTKESCRGEGRKNITHSTALRNINMPTGGYALIKNAKGAEEYGLEFDLRLAKDTIFNYVYIFGEVGDSYPNDRVFEMSAHVSLLSEATVDGLRMNVDGERGLVFDFDNTGSAGTKSAPGATVVSANVEVSNITLMRSDRVQTTPNPVSLGTLDVQLNLTNNSYVQIEGY